MAARAATSPGPSPAASVVAADRPLTGFVSVHTLGRAQREMQDVREGAAFAIEHPQPEFAALDSLAKTVERIHGQPTVDDRRSIELLVFRWSDRAVRSFSTFISPLGDETKHGRRRIAEDAFATRTGIAALGPASGHYQTLAVMYGALLADAGAPGPDAGRSDWRAQLASIEGHLHQMGTCPFAARVAAIGHADAAVALHAYAPERGQLIREHLGIASVRSTTARRGLHQAWTIRVPAQDSAPVAADHALLLHLAMNTSEFSAAALETGAMVGKRYGMLLAQNALEGGAGGRFP